MKGVKLSTGDRLFYLIVRLLLSVFFLITLYILIYLISISVSSPVAVAEGRVVLFPVGFSLEGYQMVFRNKSILSGLYNSVIYTFFGTIMNLALTLVTAYALSRRELIGRSIISFFLVFTMWFNGGLIPLFLLIRNLGLLNTRWAVWLPVSMSIYNVIITRTYIQSNIPDEIFEAASIDGCGYYRFFIQIVIPLSGAIIAVMALFYGIVHWNAYFRPLIYLNNEKLYPLQMIMRRILIANEIGADDLLADENTQANFGRVELLKYALIVVACIPLWSIYPFIQKYFVKGVMIGSIKG
ncbi:MAG: carbohydrate ABC transporter permease [Oscillospiraceae bacterium]|nr:carbohydrate ABC transporter permease [Oscillospiraceae bacterium]